jgi:branched-chain amino acid transport system permease protein
MLNVILNNTLRSPLRFLGVLFLIFLANSAIQNVIAGEYTLETFISQFIFGLSQGSVYALIALGYTLVYGILFMINFAHSEVFMAGAYIGFFAIHAMDESGFLHNQTALALIFTILVGMTASVVIALLLERIAYRPLRNAPRLVPLITAIGASIAIQQLFLLLFGGSPRVYPEVSLFILPGVAGCELVDGVQVCPGIDIIDGRYDVLLFGYDIRIRPIFFVVLFLSLVLMAILWFFVKRTRTGKAMRAVAEDKNTAALMGINVDRVIVMTFVLGAALAGAGAVLFALYNQQVTPFMGFLPGIKAFTSAVLGGIGNIPGAMFGGLFLGVVESVMPSLLGLPGQLKDLVAFGTLILFMIFRPTGIFGEVITKKKA